MSSANTDYKKITARLDVKANVKTNGVSQGRRRKRGSGGGDKH